MIKINSYSFGKIHRLQSTTMIRAILSARIMVNPRYALSFLRELLCNMSEKIFTGIKENWLEI